MFDTDPPKNRKRRLIQPGETMTVPMQLMDAQQRAVADPFAAEMQDAAQRRLDALAADAEAVQAHVDRFNAMRDAAADAAAADPVEAALKAHAVRLATAYRGAA